MERLTSVEGLEEKLMRDRYANLFFINDLALFPGSDIAVYRIGGLYALNYRNDGMCLFSDGDFDLGEAKAFLDGQDFHTLMGEGSLMKAFIPLYAGSRVLERDMLALDRNDLKAVDRGYDTRLLDSVQDILSVKELYHEIPEFDCPPPTLDLAMAEAGRSDTLYCGTFVNGQLVSTATLSAICAKSAMVTGVATREGWRNRGCASHTLSRLASAGFSQLGLDYVCLWYSDETALAVYRKLGFRSVARFTSITIRRTQE